MKCGQNKNILISIILQWSLNQEESEDDCSWEIRVPDLVHSQVLKLYDMVFILKWAKSNLLRAIYILMVLNFQMINYFFIIIALVLR